jgi:hypothetical protein
VGRQPDPDVGDQRLVGPGPLLQQVQHVPPVEHPEVAVRTHLVHEPTEQRPGEPLQAVVPQVGGADLEGG